MGGWVGGGAMMRCDGGAAGSCFSGLLVSMSRSARSASARSSSASARLSASGSQGQLTSSRPNRAAARCHCSRIEVR